MNKAVRELAEKIKEIGGEWRATRFGHGYLARIARPGLSCSSFGKTREEALRQAFAMFTTDWGGRGSDVA